MRLQHNILDPVYVIYIAYDSLRMSVCVHITAVCFNPYNEEKSDAVAQQSGSICHVYDIS